MRGGAGVDSQEAEGQREALKKYTIDLTERARLPVGLTGRVWWGSRSVNLHAAYGMAAGLWVEGRYAPDGGALDVVVGLDGDLGFITLPVVVLWNWLTR